MKSRRTLVLRNVDPAKLSVTKQKEIQERYYVGLVHKNAHYRLIVAMLSEGVAVPEIARHFAENGWTGSVNERTFGEALRAYRRVCAEEIKASDHGQSFIETVAPANAPARDPISALQQLLRLQMIRIGIDVKTEKDIGKLFGSTAKEMEVAAKMTETLLKASGKIKENGAAGGEVLPADVSEDLTKLRREEATNSRLYNLTKQLVTK